MAARNEAPPNDGRHRRLLAAQLATGADTSNDIFRRRAPDSGETPGGPGEPGRLTSRMQSARRAVEVLTITEEVTPESRPFRTYVMSPPAGTWCMERHRLRAVNRTEGERVLARNARTGSPSASPRFEGSET